MGEYIWTRVTVGGTLKRSDVERLTGEMRFESGRDGDDTGELELEAAMKENRAAVVFEGESNYGGATSMLDLLRKLGLPYRKECDRYYEYDADIETWDGHPDHKPINYVCNSDKDPIISLPALRHAAKQGETLAEIIASLEPAEAEPPALIIHEDLTEELQEPAHSPALAMG